MDQVDVTTLAYEDLEALTLEEIRMLDPHKISDVSSLLSFDERISSKVFATGSLIKAVLTDLPTHLVSRKQVLVPFLSRAWHEYTEEGKSETGTFIPQNGQLNRPRVVHASIRKALSPEGVLVDLKEQ